MSMAMGLILRFTWEDHILSNLFGQKQDEETAELFRQRVSYGGIFNLFETV